LIESLDEGALDERAEELWSAEIARRIADIDAGRVQLVPWSDVRRRLFDE
jgi:putative addiction module component (TIGR02574 family)